MADQDEVNRVNFSGRVHPSQRWAVLDSTFWLALAVLLACLWVVGYRWKDIHDTNLLSQHNEFIKPRSFTSALPYLSPVLLMSALLLWVCVRRIAELSRGRLVAISGRTHDVGDRSKTLPLPQGPLVLYTTYSRGMNPEYNLRVGGKSHRMDRKLHDRIRPEHDNTAFLTPITKRLINVAPSP